jgi:hypothetical protein
MCRRRANHRTSFQVFYKEQQASIKYLITFLFCRKTRELYLEKNQDSKEHIIAIPPDSLPLKGISHGFYNRPPDNDVSSCAAANAGRKHCFFSLFEFEIGVSY